MATSARCAARQRRSPLMMMYFPSPCRLTVMGWMTPSVRIESASSSSASSSNCVRGCVGLGMISETAISAISVIGLSFASRGSLPKMASNPLPNPFCFILSRN